MIITLYVQKNINDKAIAKRMRESRLKLGLSQERLAKILDVTRALIDSYESGRNRIKTLFALLYCCRFDLNLDWFATGKGLLNDPPYYKYAKYIDLYNDDKVNYNENFTEWYPLFKMKIKEINFKTPPSRADLLMIDEKENIFLPLKDEVFTVCNDQSFIQLTNLLVEVSKFYKSDPKTASIRLKNFLKI